MPGDINGMKIISKVMCVRVVKMSKLVSKVACAR